MRMNRSTASAAIVASALAISADAQFPIVAVPAGGDLQAALNAARPGETLALEPGATYVGNFVLPARSGNDTKPITIRTGGLEAVPEGQRITPQTASRLAKLRSPDNVPSLRTAAGARYWRVELLEFLPNRIGNREIIGLGDPGQRSREEMSSDLVLDRVYVHGDPVTGQKRGIALNSARTTISNSYMADLKWIGEDSQAIAGWNGAGDYLIENNFLEAAGENLIFGGSDPSIIGLTPERIVIRGNTLSKPLSWRQSGSPWQVKNIFELKNARDVIVERNLFERNWQAGQSGYAILFTVRNQDGGCPWCQVEQVQFRQNIVRDVAAGFQILGIDNNHPSRQTNAIVIRDNVFDGIDSRLWGGDGSWFQLTDAPRDVTVDHNTVIQGTSNGVIKVDGRVDGFVFTNNVASHGSYGIIASDRGVGNDSIRSAFPGGSVTANVLAGGEPRLYPPGNFFPSVQEFRREFMDFDGHDFRLRPASPWLRAGTDGRDLGADLSRMPRLPSIDRRRTPSLDSLKK